MATLKGSTIAGTYDQLVQRAATYSQTGTNIELMDGTSNAAAQATGLYLESGATTSHVGIGVAAPDAPLHIVSDSEGTVGNDGVAVPQLLVESTGDTQGHTGPTIALLNSSAGASSDTDLIGAINFLGDDDDGDATGDVSVASTYGLIYCQILDMTEATTDGALYFAATVDDSITTHMYMAGGNTEIIGTGYAWVGQDTNTVWGKEAGTSLHADSQYNTLIGYQAADATCTDTTDYNTAVGNGALGALTEASSNTCLGAGSGGSITTGNSNVMLGFRAGNTVVDYHYNICIGQDSDINTGISNGIAIGQAATVYGQYGIALGDTVTAVAADDFAFGRASNVVKCDFGTDAVFERNSDERKKCNIENDTLGLEFINDLRTVTYKWKPAEEHPEEWHAWEDLKDEDGELTGEKEYHKMTTDIVMHGMIAQEVKAALDTAGVDTFKGWDENPNGQQLLSAEMFVFPLIKAVQELSAKVTALENA